MVERPELFEGLVVPNHKCTEACHPENCPVEAKVLNEWEEDLRMAAVAHQEGEGS